MEMEEAQKRAQWFDKQRRTKSQTGVQRAENVSLVPGNSSLNCEAKQPIMGKRMKIVH